MTKLYKYMGADIADKLMMDRAHIGIKFSHLKDYNDPYEFFLTINYDRNPDELAFYSEMIDMVVKQPATCFSRSPVITPMWAHYAGNSSGFVIEINEDGLLEHLQELGFSEYSLLDDVKYQDRPDDIDDLLRRACYIGKPRYIYFLQSYIRHSAYLRKQTCWSYEQERRLITSEQALTKVNDWLMLLPIPIDCVTSFIVGKNANESLKEKIRQLAEQTQANYLEMVFGRVTTDPFMLLDGHRTHIFIDGEIASASSACQRCKEPINADEKFCSWCSITNVHRQNAALSNSFRMLDDAGILENYLSAIRKVGKEK
ncbi:DUF2971 domain-containing protein [Morganella morganii]|uniref:DUF2971 domain-containing protein n=1 Tax=Morganella morganii TaxID=582 RepID=UPI0007DB89AD|nr:DUF2971 domain-containing protein [Morganella morganii]MCW3199505.1 DUF2971 domain-containing protein [Morganella morganii]OAR95979.1 hypothetical protein AYO06_02990 [Morganella morganii]WPU20049.1 DUF2971 domain-containing protein [Morganella morganii]HEI8463737.1 DUF2971 domain-containing protein [Morganella morganii]